MSLSTKWFGFGRDAAYDDAMRAFERGAFADAAQGFESCLAASKEPSTVRLAKLYLGECCARLADAALEVRRGQDALTALDRALMLHPDYPDLHLKAARASGIAGDRARERAEIETALKLNPDYAAAKIYAGALELRDSGSADEAEKVLKDAADLPAQDANSRASHGDALVKLRRFEEAAREYELALQIAPQYADIRCRLGQTLLELDRVEEAVHAFRQALEVNPEYVEALAQLGIALKRLGNDQEAKEAFKRVLSLDPSHAIAQLEVGRG